MKKPLSLELSPRYRGKSSWWEHVPVAHILIELTKPKLVVELGTHYGVSFFAFCEAAERYSPQTFVYAIDTWGGDSQAGFYNDEVYNIVEAHKNQYHIQRASLIRALFNDASKQFGNETIDMLHIDGLHTYEAVLNDYNVWLPKLRYGGTVLFHDWNVRKDGFGVWKLWEEVKKDQKFQCLEFTNGYGLGLATLSNEKPEWHQVIENNTQILQTKGLLLENINNLETKLELLETKTMELRKHIRNLESMNKDKQKQLLDASETIESLIEKRYTWKNYRKRLIDLMWSKR